MWQQYFKPPVCVRHGGLAGSGAVKGTDVSLLQGVCAGVCVRVCVCVCAASLASCKHLLCGL